MRYLRLLSLEGGGFARLVSSDVEDTFFRSETQPVLHARLDPYLGFQWPPGVSYC